MATRRNFDNRVKARRIGALERRMKMLAIVVSTPWRQEHYSDIALARYFENSRNEIAALHKRIGA